MSIPRRAAKRDEVESEIVQALIDAGCTIVRLSMQDVPDLLVGYIDPVIGPANVLMEVKTGNNKLRDGQQKWIDRWNGSVYVVRSVEDALFAIGRLDNDADVT